MKLPQSHLRVAVVQMCSSEDVEQNARVVLQRLAELRGQAVDLVSFPENTFYLRVQSAKVPGFNLKEYFWREIQSWCMETGAKVHIGSVPLKEGKKLTNATVWVDKKGARVQYRKIHLFDVDVVGEKRIRESDYFKAGRKPEIVKCNDWPVGLSICYDLRFSELFLTYALKDVPLILVPSAFLVPTGQAHWHTLLRARAIECQAYVVAAAQGGVHRSQSSERQTFGHSLVVDPWGRVLWDAQDVGVKVVELDPALLKTVRSQIPMQDHRVL